MDLLEIRDQIDEIDDEILRLFEKRMGLCADVADFKIRTGKKVFDKEREQAKLKVLGGKASSDFTKHGIQELFQQIMSISRKLQYQILARYNREVVTEFEKVEEIPKDGCTVVFQGVEGAYSFAAMQTFFAGNDIKSFHVERWKDAMEAICDGKADYAVLPIENSTAGIVQDIFDLLVEYDNYIVGEQVIRCQHTLVGVPGTTLDDIETVYSHPQALMQCKAFLDQHSDWVQEKFLNTAAAAKKVAEDGDKRHAAIASEHAAEFYGLEVLAKDIYTIEENSTRFIIVAKNRMYTEQANKISVFYELPHENGSLYNSMGHFVYNNLNMTKIESRPLPDRSWEYGFFVDFEGNLSDGAVRNAIHGLKNETNNFRILGNY